MDDDGKNSETDLVGELWAPQNVWFDHSAVFLTLEVATGICLPDTQNIHSHMDTAQALEAE